MSRCCGDYKELLGARARTLAASEALDLQPWAYEVYVSGTLAQDGSGPTPAPARRAGSP